jgi:hypothetical protein
MRKRIVYGFLLTALVFNLLLGARSIFAFMPGGRKGGRLPELELSPGC